MEWIRRQRYIKTVKEEKKNNKKIKKEVRGTTKEILGESEKAGEQINRKRNE